MHRTPARLATALGISALLSLSSVSGIQAAGSAPAAVPVSCEQLRHADPARYQAQCVKHDPILIPTPSLASPGGVYVPPPVFHCSELMPYNAPKGFVIYVGC